MRLRVRLKVRLYILGFYDLLLAIGAAYLLSKLAFEDWSLSGTSALLLFTVCNMVASIFCFVKKNHLSWSLSAVMGSILYVILVFQVLMTGVWQLSTAVFFALSILQLFFSRIVYLGYQKKAKRYSEARSYI